MMAAVKAARHGALAPYLKTEHVGIGSINSPMQCMMKEVCAQCLQKHVDPATGKEEIIFSCFNQDQELDRVDFPNLAARLRQNTVQEKLSNLWLDHLLGEGLEHVYARLSRTLQVRKSPFTNRTPRRTARRRAGRPPR